MIPRRHSTIQPLVPILVAQQSSYPSWSLDKYLACILALPFSQSTLELNIINKENQYNPKKFYKNKAKNLLTSVSHAVGNAEGLLGERFRKIYHPSEIVPSNDSLVSSK